MKISEHIKTLLERRNVLAQESNTEGDAILEVRVQLDKNHKSDCPCRNAADKSVCTDTTYSEGMGGLKDRVEAQKAKRAEIEELDSLIGAGENIEDKILKTEREIGAVTEGGMSAVAMSALYPKNREKILSRIGTDFHGFLQQVGLTKGDDVKQRPTLKTSKMKNGDVFNTVASFYATFGKNAQELTSTAKSIGSAIGLGDTFVTALKTRRESLKSMFTQHPLAGGDGELYAPTEVFPGNTGGLCEYIIDDAVDVLPYPPVSFLDCIPVRQIPKSYVLYARQTLRVNNAAGVGESIFLPGIDNPTEAPVDFLVTKPESEFGFSQASAYTITFADTLAVSEEFLEDCPAIADAVETQLMENVRQEFYDQIINGDGSGGENPEILGLLAQVGLSTRVHQGAATFFGNVMGAGAVDDNLRETIVRAIFDAEAYGYTVDCVLMSHEDYVQMFFLKDELGHPLYTDAQLDTIQGAKVRKDVRMPAGTALVGAFRQVVQLLIRRAIRLDIGWVDSQFTQDMLTLRATMRGGLLVKAPHALIRVTGI